MKTFIKLSLFGACLGLSQISFGAVKKTYSNQAGVEVYADSKFPDYQITRQALQLPGFPFAGDFKEKEFFKSLEAIRLQASKVAGFRDFRFDSYESSKDGANALSFKIRGSYKIGEVAYKFEERQEIRNNKVNILVVTTQGILRPQVAHVDQIQRELANVRKPAASDKSETAADYCVSCAIDTGKPDSVSDLTDLSEQLKEDKNLKTRMAEVEAQKCSAIKEKHREKNILKMDGFKKTSEENFFETVAKGALNCQSRVIEQLVQGGWDLLSFAGMLVKEAAIGTFKMGSKVVSAQMDLAKAIYDPKERKNLVDSAKSFFNSGVSKTEAGFAYLAENSVTGILHAGGQKIKDTVKSIANTKDVVSNAISKMFKSYVDGQKSLWSCLKGREKYEYFCEWTGYVAGLFIPPSAAIKAIRGGTMMASVIKGSEKLMGKYKAVGGEGAAAQSAVVEAVRESLETSKAIHPKSVPSDLVKNIGEIKGSAGVDGALAEAVSSGSQDKIKAVVNVTKLSEEGKLERSIAEAAGKATEHEPGFGRKLMNQLCDCGFCPTKGKKTSMLEWVMPSAVADAKKCADVAAQVQELLKPVKGLSKDAERGKTYFYWGRLRYTIDSIDDKALNNIFSKINPEEFTQIYDGIRSGYIKVDRPTEEFFEQMAHFIDDVGKDTVFAGKDRTYQIKEALRAKDSAAGFNGSLDAAGTMTEQSLKQTEAEVVARAIGEATRSKKYPNAKWHDPLVNYFSSQAGRLETILDANNKIRKGIQIMSQADIPVESFLATYGKELSPEGLTALRSLISDTSTKLASTREALEKIYGRELSQTYQPLRESEIRLKEVVKKVESTRLADSLAKDNVVEAGRDMDLIDHVLEDLWQKKAAQDPKWAQSQNVRSELGFYRPSKDAHPIELQIQNPKMASETGMHSRTYYNITDSNTPLRSSYDTQVSWSDDVTFHWTEEREVTKTREVNGKTESYIDTEYVPRSDTVSVPRSKGYEYQASFEQNLRGKIEPDLDQAILPSGSTAGAYSSIAPSSASTTVSQSGKRFSRIDTAATDAMVRRSAQTRASEAPFRNTIEAVSDRMKTINNESYQKALKNNDQATLNAYRKQLSDDTEKLVVLRKQMAEYGSADQGKVKAAWTDDKPEIFRDRNSQMSTRIDHMLKRISFLDEQIARKQSSLQVEFNLPDYSPQLAQLQKIDKGHKRVIYTTAAAATVTTPLALYFGSPAVKEKVDAVAAEMGLVEKKKERRGRELKEAWMK